MFEATLISISRLQYGHGRVAGFVLARFVGGTDVAFKSFAEFLVVQSDFGSHDKIVAYSIFKSYRDDRK